MEAPPHEKKLWADEEPLRVLLVEDMPTDAELALYELAVHGMPFVSKRVCREPELEEALKEFKPTVILSDYSMPEMDGLRALKMARDHAGDTPFIFVSGTIGEERATEALKNGAVDYVLKTNLTRLAPAVARAVREADNRRSREKLEAAWRRQAAIMDATPDFVGICDTELRLHYINAGGSFMLGLAHGTLPASLRYLSDDVRSLLLQEAVPEALLNGSWRGETELLGASGEAIPVSLVLIVHADRDGEIEFISCIARDIRDRKAYESRIRYLANFDALTDLPNRTLLQDRAAQAIRHGRKQDSPIALLAIDLDNFTLVNEGCGQIVGDQVLREVALRIRSVLPDDATAARLSGNTFAVLLVDLVRPDDALVLASTIADAIAEPISMEGHDIQLSASIGIATWPRDGETLDALLRNVDSALHRAKTRHPSGIQFYNTRMTDEAIARLENESLVRGALRQGEITLHYQPQFDIRSKRIIGVEALLRWQHPRLGLVPPGNLISLAEEIGTINTIGSWVLEEACRQAVEWMDAGAPPVRVGVNVSPRQLRDASFVETVEDVLRVTGLSPSLLELEITESSLMGDAEESVRILQSLKALGVSLALDDFGTGYSSLSYLSRFPIDRLKIDHSFVFKMLEERHDREIVLAILSLAKVLGLSVIAEGIEDEAQREFLATSGCSEGQGYLVGKALAAEAIGMALGAKGLFDS